MAAGRFNFTIEQGTTVDFAVVYKDSNGNPIDLTGYDARMQLRPSYGSETTYLTLSSSLNDDGTGLNLSGSGGVNASSPLSSGSIGIYVSHVTSSQFNFTEAIYDLEIVSGSGNTATVSRILQGVISLSKESTTGTY